MFEKYKSLSESGIRLNSKVVVKYKGSIYYNKTGKVVSIMMAGPNKGDCRVLMDYDRVNVDFLYTFLMRVEEFVEVPSGEVFNISYDDAVDLAFTGIVKWHERMGFYYFKEEDRWQIESYAL